MSQHAQKKPTDLEIMLYLDGELGDVESKAVAQWLENDQEAARKATALGQMGELVRTSVELAADEAEPKLGSLWAGIDSSINANGVSKQSSDSLGGAGAASVSAMAEKRATDALVKKASWFGGWQGHVATGALVAAAVAILMYVVRPERVVETQAGTQRMAQQKSENPVTIPVTLESQEPEVEELEVYGGTGIIMTVHGDDQGSGDDDGSSAVIWISNDTDVVEEPI